MNILQLIGRDRPLFDADIARCETELLERVAASRFLVIGGAGYGWPGFQRMNLWRQDKGQKACAAAFVQAVQQGGPAPIPLDEILEVSRIAIELA